MAKTKISEFSATPANNTDIDGINIAEGCAPSGINDAIRELMAQLKDWQSGTSNDPYIVGSSGSLTLNQGTANGVPYLNGSKVLTTGSALVFDGTNLGIGTSSPVSKLDVVETATIKRVTSGNTMDLNFYNGSGAGTTGNVSRIRCDGDGISNDYGALSFWTGRINSAAITEKMRLDSLGNLGLGVTPSAWDSTFKSLQVPGGAVSGYSPSQIQVIQNAYYNAGWKYTATAAASRYGQDSGVHAWYNAASGTAGNAISFTQAMTLDASGNLGVGRTSPNGRLHVQTASGNTDLYIQTGDTTSSSRLIFGDSADSNMGSVEYLHASDAMVFKTNNEVERARIDSSGNVGIGTTSTGSAKLTVRSGTGTAHTILGNDYGSLYLETASGGPNRITSLNSALNSGQALAFNGSGGAEWGRFDTSGTLLVGQTTNPATSTMVIKVSTGSANGVNAQITSNTGTSYPWSNYNASGTYVGGISCTSTGTAFPTSSDYRLKEDVQPMTGALAKVAALKPCTYKWKLNGSDGQGFIAHELAEVVPDAVIGEKDAVDADGNPQYQGIDTSFLVATLTAAIQEQQALIASQSAIITALTARVAALESN